MLRKSAKFLFCFIFTTLSFNAIGQYYTMGNDPQKAKWMQIKSEHYTLIYPREIDSLARLYLFSLENNRASVLEPLGINPKRIPVVLHPYSTVSNGSVSWAPKRMDLLTTPDAYGGTPEPWIDQLVIHESRHVGQTEHFTKGVYKPLYYLLGEQITGLGMGIYPSTQFLEGDAVIAETELSNGGRGRQAEFLMYSRTAYLNGDYRNWNRLLLGSHRYYTPNNYVFGYLINAAVRYDTGDYFYTGKHTASLVKNWYNPAVTSKTYRDLTGHNRKYYLTLSQEILTEIWKKDAQKRGKQSPSDTILARRERLYCDYVGAEYISDKNSPLYGSIITIKKGMEHPSKMVSVDSLGKEHFIRPFNPYSSPLSLCDNGKIYWSETISRETSTLEDFSIIRYYDVETGRTKNLTPKSNTRHFNPNPNDDIVAVAEYPVEGSSYAVILSADDGSVIKRIEAPGKGQIKDFLKHGDDYYASVIIDKGLGIYRYRNNEWQEIVPQQNHSIDGLSSDGKGLYFSSDLEGVQDIYYFEPENRLLFRITNTLYGATAPFIDPNSGILYYSEYGHMGYFPAKTALDSLQWKISSFSDPYKDPIAEMLSLQARQSSGIIKKDTIDSFDTELYPAKKYNKLTHLFRFHSWAPVYYNIDNIRELSYDRYYDLASLGATLYSQNTLGSAVTMLGYSYHGGFHSGHFKFDYKGLTPHIQLTFDINDRYSYVYDIVHTAKEGSLKLSSYPNIHNPYINTNLLIYFPFSFNNGGWEKALIPQLNLNYSNDSFYSYDKSKYVNKIQLSYGLTYYQVRHIAKSQIYPRFGYSVTAKGASGLGSGENFGNMLYLYGYLYLPGIIRQQGLKLTATWQRQFADNKMYLLGSYATLPIGYTNINPTREYVKGTASYAIPIYLGDFSILDFFYFRRMQLIPFGEYARDRSQSGTIRDYYSYGTDLLVDFNVLIATLFSFSAGVRYAWTGPQDGNRNYFGFLFNIAIR